MEFKENKDNTGEYKFLTDKGSYILDVEFINSAGSAQYVGNVVIQ
jgi:ribose 5-phosphate isomerase